MIVLREYNIKYDIKNKTYEHYLKDEECITSYFYTAIQDKDGYVWLGTANCGLIRFDPNNESIRFYFNDARTPINLVNKQIRILLQDLIILKEYIINLFQVPGQLKVSHYQ